MISVVVCTRDRPAPLHRALRSVLSHSDGDLEVVVVDGSVPPVDVHQVPELADARVRLLTGRRDGVGAARADGLDAARGNLLAWCDDDDEWAPDHLAVLAGALREHPDVDLVYGDALWEQDGVVSSPPYSVDLDGSLLAVQNYIFASDVVVRTEAVRRAGGFDRTLAGSEDWDLWLRLATAARLRHMRVVVGTRHWTPSCLSADPDWGAWQRVHDRHRARLEAAGTAAAHDLDVGAARSAPFDPATWTVERRELLWHSMLRPNEGYGSVGRQLLPALAALGVDVVVAPTRNQPPLGFERYFRDVDSWGRLAFYYDYRLQPSCLPVERISNYSMWESTEVPAEHVAEINTAVRLQYVPCRQNLESHLEAGVTVPIKVLHHGVNTTRFPLLERPERDVFTFGSFGDLSPRKGIDALLRAFCEEFTPREPVRLRLKATGTMPAYAYTHSGVQLLAGYLDDTGLQEFLRSLDAFVLPSRGEGFGLCGLEAMATGLPLVATGWSGPAEYLDESDSYPLAYRLVDTRGCVSNGVTYHGAWAEPDHDHLRVTLRHLYEHPDEARAHGQHAAGRVRRYWTWERVARQLLTDLDDVAGAQPLAADL